MHHVELPFFLHCCPMRLFLVIFKQCGIVSNSGGKKVDDFCDDDAVTTAAAALSYLRSPRQHIVYLFIQLNDRMFKLPSME